MVYWNWKLVRCNRMFGTILKRDRRPQNVDTVIENYRFVEAQQIYEIICYEIKENSMQSKKDDDVDKRHGKIDEFVWKTTCSTTRARKITRLLVHMVAIDARPAAIVEGTGFKRLVNYLEPGYKVSSAVHITSCLHRYSQVEGVVIKHLQNVSYIVLTSDIWTSLATQLYISATTHFITSEWD